MKRFVITRKLTKKEYPWLDFPINKGDIMYSFCGYTYGCISNKGAALTFSPEGEGPFIEIPKDAFRIVGN